MPKRKALSFDTETLTNDLKASTGQGVDAFFPSANPQPPTPPVHQEKAKEATDRPTVRPTDRPTAGEKEAQPKVRKKVRHTFDLYEDQLDFLLQQQLEAIQNEGKKLTMGALVIEALDLLIEKRTHTTQEESDRSTDRPTENGVTKTKS